MSLPSPSQTRGLRDETRALWTLSWPIIVGQVGFNLRGFVDTLFAGPLGAEAMAGLSLGNIVFFGLFVLGSGTVRALDAWVSQAWGAGRVDDCARGLAQTHWIVALLVLPLSGLMLATPPALAGLGYDPALVQATRDYLVPMVWGAPAGLLFSAYRSFLSGVNLSRPILTAAIVANVANVALNWLWIDGKLGAPALGVVGIAWSTTVCRFVMFGVLLWVVFRHPLLRALPPVLRAPESGLIRLLLAIGLPSGLALFAEFGAFGGAGVLMGLKGAVPLAAHQIALNVTSLLFMVPLGLSSGAAVRCGQALGAGDLDAVERAGHAALWSGVAYAGVSATLLLLFARPVAGLYRLPDDVLQMAVAFLGIAAFFQLVDSLQVLGTGVLRGLGDTRPAMIYTLIGYIGLGLPAGWLGAFVLSDDPRWLWHGLTLGLSVVSVLALLRFRALLSSLRSALAPPPLRP